MRIDLSRYNIYSDYLVGEVMSIDGDYITVSLYPDRYGAVRLASPFYISSSECGLFAIAVSNITKAKYGKEFTLFKRELGSESTTIYPDLKTHYNYIIEVLNIYYIDLDGYVHLRRGCNPSPHDEAYIMDDNDFREILSFKGFNKDLIRYISEFIQKPIFMRELLYRIRDTLEDYDANMILSNMLESLYIAGVRNLDIFLRDFKEVFGYV